MKILPGTKEEFPIRAARIQQNHNLVSGHINCDQQQTISKFSCSRQVFDSSETLA
jgi:hypothetical protein